MGSFAAGTASSPRRAGLSPTTLHGAEHPPTRPGMVHTVLPAQAGTKTSCVAHSSAYGNLIHHSQLEQHARHHRHHQPVSAASRAPGNDSGPGSKDNRRGVASMYSQTFCKMLAQPGNAASPGLEPGMGGDMMNRHTDPGAREWRHRVQVRLHHHQGDVVQIGDALGEPPRVTAHASTGRGAPHGCKNIALLQ